MIRIQCSGLRLSECWPLRPVAFQRASGSVGGSTLTSHITHSFSEHRAIRLHHCTIRQTQTILLQLYDENGNLTGYPAGR